jgi:capsular exopolysaccharide synthesis family protein
MDAPLNFNKQISDRFERERSEVHERPIVLSEIFEQLTGFIRRQLPIFVFGIACALSIGLVYLITTPASFTSHAMLLIDSSKLRVLRNDAPMGDAPIDTAQVETQVEILKSENIGLSVIKDLKLTEDPEFASSRGGLFGKILGFARSPLDFLTPSKVQSETALTRKVLATFLAKRSITRVGRTYVLDIAYTSYEAAHSAIIANAIADAYVVDQLDAKYQATRRASSWLQDRIKELRQQVSDADRAVLSYKEKNNIVSVGGTSAAGPRLLGEQQIEELNTQLGSARAAAEEAKARLQRIDEIMKRDVPDATVTDSLRNDVINRLRNNYLDLAAKESIWSARYGSSHLAAVNLRTQMTELRRAILDELGRIAQSYKSDFEIAKSRADGLERNLESLVSNSQVINRDRLGLRDLESTAQVYHTLYDSFLTKYMEAIQQQSFPITEARVISPAAAPERKSGPLTSVVLGIAGVIGIVLSFGAAVLREAVDRVFRSKRQVEDNLNAHCLAVLPMLGPKKGPKKSPVKGRPVGDGGVSDSIVPAVSATAGERQVGSLEPQLLGDGPAKVAHPARSEPGRNILTRSGLHASEKSPANRSIVPSRPYMRQVLDDPLSSFAEAFRSIKVAADLNGSRVIGITSTVPGEGKSTVASNFASLIAHAGKRVIVVDGDLRNPSLTRALARDAKRGLLEVLDGQVTLEEAIYVDKDTGLRVLPAVVKSDIAYTSEILASDAFKNFVEDLRKSHDYVVIDLSPIAPVVDVRATTQFIDCYIYVIEWGRTRINLVQHQLASFPELQERLLGVVLNKADVRVLERYETYYGKYHYKNYYGGQTAYRRS